MTEAQWLACADPAAMLEWLTAVPGYANDLPRPRVSDRKLRLFAIACERHFNRHEPDPRRRALVGAKCDAAELWADGLATAADVVRARHPDLTDAEVANVPWQTAAQDASDWCRGPHGSLLPEAAKVICGLLREVVGNPWRPVALCGMARKPFHTQHAHVNESGGFWLEAECPACADLRTPAVLRVAEGVYAARDWDALEVLADALEESGCESAELLGHLRGRCPLADTRGVHLTMVDPSDCPHCSGDVVIRPAPTHARGCWALDLLLGKT